MSDAVGEYGRTLRGRQPRSYDARGDDRTLPQHRRRRNLVSHEMAGTRNENGVPIGR